MFATQPGSPLGDHLRGAFELVGFYPVVHIVPFFSEPAEVMRELNLIPYNDAVVCDDIHFNKKR
jgi:hypothetical protein